MHPEIHSNYFAVLAAMAANIVIGFLWYGPIFGKAWMKEAGMDPNCKPDPKKMTRAMILMVIGAFLMAYVMAYSIDIWRPSTWKTGADQSNAVYGGAAAFFNWIGFCVPLLLSTVAWEGKSSKLFCINAGYWSTALLAAGMILSYWR